MLENVQPQISVIIPTCNGERFIEACLQSLYEHTRNPLEVIIVDNASTDNTLEKIGLIAQEIPNNHQIHIKNVMNTGFAHAVNQGLKAATGDLFLLLNQDSQIKTDWLSPVLAILSDPNSHKIGIVGCQLVDAQGQVSHLGGTVIQPLGEGFHFKLPEDSNDIQFVTGAAMIITRQCYAEVGEFDAVSYTHL
ncbi:MAG: glycosyltransferase, partial [Anaerolineae bacterium]|nr:glycosyltransferase [Anaerolineae bacterium]